MHADQSLDHLFAWHLLQADCLAAPVDWLIVAFALQRLGWYFALWQYSNQSAASLELLFSTVVDPLLTAHPPLGLEYEALWFSFQAESEVPFFQQGSVQFHLNEFDGLAHPVQLGLLRHNPNQSPSPRRHGNRLNSEETDHLSIAFAEPRLVLSWWSPPPAATKRIVAIQSNWLGYRNLQFRSVQHAAEALTDVQRHR